MQKMILYYLGNEIDGQVIFLLHILSARQIGFHWTEVMKVLRVDDYYTVFEYR